MLITIKIDKQDETEGKTFVVEFFADNFKDYNKYSTSCPWSS